MKSLNRKSTWTYFAHITMAIQWLCHRNIPAWKINIPKRRGISMSIIDEAIERILRKNLISDDPLQQHAFIQDLAEPWTDFLIDQTPARSIHRLVFAIGCIHETGLLNAELRLQQHGVAGATMYYRITETIRAYALLVTVLPRSFLKALCVRSSVNGDAHDHHSDHGNNRAS